MRRPKVTELTIAAVAAIYSIPTASAGKKEPPPVVYGPPPEWRRFKALGEDAVKALLVDPDSAKISWPNGYIQKGYTPFLKRRVNGYTTCGLVNSRNRMGGYAGTAPFTVVIDNDTVLYAEIAHSNIDMLSTACSRAGFPSAALMTNGPRRPGYGFSFGMGLESAYVDVVRPGGSAEQAGLKSGMMFTHVNGVSLKGVPDGFLDQLLHGADGPIVLTMEDGTSMRLVREAANAPPVPDRDDPELTRLP